MIRAFYWSDRRATRFERLSHAATGRFPVQRFLHANAGDQLAVDLLQYLYEGEKVRNITDEGGRLLAIGSLAHLVRPGDVLCGIGTKGRPVPRANDTPCIILALRGPITAERFAEAGHSLADLRSLRDPGLMIRFLVDPRPATPGRRVFVPHYRERNLYRRTLPSGVDFLDIDSGPIQLAHRIQSAEMVYASSLHGLIFAHALGRPAMLVHPQTAEPLTKYEDYVLSLDLAWKRPPMDIFEALRRPAPSSPISLRFSERDFGFPRRDELDGLGVTTNNRR